MTKKEKIIAILMTITLFLMIGTTIFTLEKNKPQEHVFQYEKWIFQVFKK